MTNCKNCGQPLKKGNIRWERPPIGRPYRVHRRCKRPNERRKDIISGTVRLVDLPIICDNCPDTTECLTQDPAKRVCLKWGRPRPKAHIEPPEPWPRGDTAGSTLQQPQDNTGGPFVAEGVETPAVLEYRFFMTQELAERLRDRLQNDILLTGFGVGFEVVPVLEDEVERNPDVYAALVEVIVNWKVE